MESILLTVNLTREQYYRFLSKFDQKGQDECWNWLGSTNTDGYGKFPLYGTSVMAHRVSWILNNGDIPEGLFVRHKCDNRICVNPNHLELGTHQENIKDRVDRGRCAKGERNHSKLKEAQVLELRKLWKTGLSSRKLGKMFGISYSTVLSIVHRRKWSWLE